MSDATKDISVRLGTAFAAISEQFLDAIAEGVGRSDKKVSYSATVSAQIKDGGIVACQMVPHEPKIPTEPQPTIDFILKRDEAGQLSFLFGGSLDELKAEADRLARERQPDDGYAPGHSASPREE